MTDPNYEWDWEPGDVKQLAEDLKLEMDAKADAQLELSKTLGQLDDARRELEDLRLTLEDRSAALADAERDFVVARRELAELEAEVRSLPLLTMDAGWGEDSVFIDTLKMPHSGVYGPPPANQEQAWVGQKPAIARALRRGES